jgi:hypothetical protein
MKLVYVVFLPLVSIISWLRLTCLRNFSRLESGFFEIKLLCKLVDPVLLRAYDFAMYGHIFFLSYYLVFSLNMVSNFFVNIQENEFGLKFNFYMLGHCSQLVVVTGHPFFSSSFFK